MMRTSAAPPAAARSRSCRARYRSALAVLLTISASSTRTVWLSLPAGAIAVGWTVKVAAPSVYSWARTVNGVFAPTSATRRRCATLTVSKVAVVPPTMTTSWRVASSNAHTFRPSNSRSPGRSGTSVTTSSGRGYRWRALVTAAASTASFSNSRSIAVSLLPFSVFSLSPPGMAPL